MSSAAMLHSRLDAAAMSSRQWLVIAVCVLLSVLDGFDLLVMAFASPDIGAAWRLSGAQLGVLLGAGLVGMAIGSTLVAPLADRVGRRKVILACLGMSSTGMALSAFCDNIVQLTATRVLTGAGVGAVLAAGNVVASEFSNRRWRGLAVTLNGTGYAVGASLSGIVVATAAQGPDGWRVAFSWGAAGTALLAFLVLAWMPESLAFLLTRRSHCTLARLNAALTVLGHPALTSLPPPQPAGAAESPRLRRLVSPDWRRTTVSVWAGFFVVMFTFYFVASWTPKLLVEAGMSTSEGITGGVLLNLGGILGATLFGLLAVRFALRHVLVGYMSMGAVVLAVVVYTVPVPWLAYVLGWLIGLLANGAISGMYAFTVSLYPSGIRATGLGWAIGVGRVGAIAAPLVAGWLLDVGWSLPWLYLFVAAVLLLGIPAVLSGTGP
ncbi:MAG: MFS transporter [Nonomuraea sp.]|nr:MFS transporter [Nonomuraea sp.]